MLGNLHVRFGVGAGVKLLGLHHQSSSSAISQSTYAYCQRPVKSETHLFRYRRTGLGYDVVRAMRLVHTGERPPSGWPRIRPPRCSLDNDMHGLAPEPIIS